MPALAILELNAERIIESYKSGIGTVTLSKEFNCSPTTINSFLKKKGVAITARSDKWGSTRQYHDKIKELHALGYKGADICRELGISQSALWKAAPGLGIDFSAFKSGDNDICSLDQLDKIEELHLQGFNTYEIGEKLNYANNTISKRLGELGYELRNIKYEVDAHFFDNIDTEAKAYIYGFFLTDGNVYKNRIRLFITDLDILERIKKEMKYTGPFFVAQPRQSGHKVQYLLQVARKELAAALTALGCGPNKTFITTFPTQNIIPKHLVNHFVRGCWDGDGNIHVKKGGKFITATFIGTQELLQGIVDTAKEIPANFSWYKNKKYLGNTTTINMGGNIQTLRFLDWLYKDSTIHLERKYKIYKNFRDAYMLS